MGFTWIYAVVPWLALLACPVFMFWMMRGGMAGGGCGARRPPVDDESTHQTQHELTGASTEAEIAQLKAQLAKLEQRHQRGLVS